MIVAHDSEDERRSDLVFEWVTGYGSEYANLKPIRVIYNKQYTICYWRDGSKTIVKAVDTETPTHEHGVAMCIMRKLFNTRGEFLKIVNSGHDIEDSHKLGV